MNMRRRYRYIILCWCIPNRIKLMINGMKWRSLTLIIVSKGLFWGWEKINLVIDLIMIQTKLSFTIHFDWNFKTHNYILSLLYVRFCYVRFITPLKLLWCWASWLPWLQNSSVRCWSPWNPKIITYSIRVMIIVVEQATQRNMWKLYCISMYIPCVTQFKTVSNKLWTRRICITIFSWMVEAATTYSNGAAVKWQ